MIYMSDINDSCDCFNHLEYLPSEDLRCWSEIWIMAADLTLSAWNLSAYIF